MKKEHTAATSKDPVCGMEVSRESAAAEAEYDGRHYYFCSGTCRQRFLADPALYAKKGGTS
jgi:YHS domain-containing protein